jgi:hypothetical protein
MPPNGVYLAWTNHTIRMVFSYGEEAEKTLNARKELGLFNPENIPADHADGGIIYQCIPEAPVISDVGVGSLQYSERLQDLVLVVHKRNL